MKRKSSRSALPVTMVAGVLVLAAAGYLGFSILGDLLGSGTAIEYFKRVDKVLASPERWQDKRIRLHGNVVAGTIQKKPRTLDYRFAIHSGARWVEVTYNGLLPDTFKDCAEVVVKGKLRDRGHFTADEVTAKCPSKYEGQERLRGCGSELREKVLAARGRR